MKIILLIVVVKIFINKMRFFSFILCFLLSFNIGNAQSIKRSVISSIGSSSSSNNSKLISSFGQPSKIGTVTDGNNYLRQGFQQPTSNLTLYPGCLDPLAWNFDSITNSDDGSCLYSYMCDNASPTGLFVDDIVDVRATIHWDNMNTDSCRVWKNFIRYRKVGDTIWTTKAAGVGSGLCNVGLSNDLKVLRNLTPNTTYEYKLKSFYCGGNESSYSYSDFFTTLDSCPEMTNLSVQTFNGNHYKARFNWDTTGVYVFARVALRVDTTGSNWQTAGGFGVYYPNFSINKFGLSPGTSYRAQGRTFCDSNITIYRSWWTPPIFWTQPSSIRLGGAMSINNFDVYPNPSRDIYNIYFNSDKVQDIKIKILSVFGAELYIEQKENFIGDYTKQIDLSNYSKGIYFLEIEADKIYIYKKLILN